MTDRGWRPALLALFLCLALPAQAMAGEPEAYVYRIQPGDLLAISVWHEEGLQLDNVLVRPDGGISVPLAGEVSTTGKTVEDLRHELTERMNSYIPDLAVTVSVKQLFGHKIYVIGKVAKPGEFVLSGRVDVMQALSMAGGTVRFAGLKDIKILRRAGDVERVIPFDYTSVEAGEKLEQNILLEVGDVVVVP